MADIIYKTFIPSAFCEIPLWVPRSFNAEFTSCYTLLAFNTKMLAELFRSFNDIFAPSKTKGISFPINVTF